MRYYSSIQLKEKKMFCALPINSYYLFMKKQSCRMTLDSQGKICTALADIVLSILYSTADTAALALTDTTPSFLRSS